MPVITIVGPRNRGALAMDWSQNLIVFLSDERLLTNLIAVHLAIGALLIVSVLMRQALQQGSERLYLWLGLPALRSITQEAAEQVRSLVYWVTVVLMLATVTAGIVYH